MSSNSQSNVYITPPPKKKREPRYYGTFTSPNSLKKPKLEDPTLTLFGSPTKLKFSPAPLNQLKLITLDAGNTTHITANTLRRVSVPIFVEDDTEVPDSDQTESDDDSRRRRGGDESGGQNPPPAGPLFVDDYVRLTVSSLCYEDMGVEYYISVNETFEKVYEDYARRCDYTADQIRIFWGPIELLRNATPFDVEMYDEATARVYGREPEMNLDTNFKVFVIQETDDHPYELAFRVKKTVHMDRIYRNWAEHINVNHHSVVLIRKCKIKPRVGFLSDSGIRNGDRLYSMLLEFP